MTVDRSRGSFAVEVVALVPMLMSLVVLAVVGLRWTSANSDVIHAAGTAARVASESRAATGTMSGRAAGVAMLRNSPWCRNPRLSVVRVTTGSVVSYRARVGCTLNATGLSMLRMGSVFVEATSVQVVDMYRSDR